ncbi:hypothetical protein [Sphingomonas sp. Leaf343]|uniref:hypothetical protein n=1 Tax=Sphingomonas sp. Leaf343 TaxID=1736345 RepID=UPI0006F5D1E0|nr:hypothetical protein [Sphingomonas sp. Leaf343]KQR81295.1 hypothetical protein ASG07_12650 [Sphingomonas sp. Leaf343]
MLRFGPDDGPVVIASLPLFEEANRTRAFVVAVLRVLAVQGVGSILPHWPGTGESLIETQDARLMAMRAACEALVEQITRPAYALGVRSGTLIDASAPVDGRWHLSPVEGETLLRELARTRPGMDVATLLEANEPVELAGNLLSPTMLSDLANARVYDGEHVPRRVVRLDSDPRPADLKMAGAPLWRRAEPGSDRALAERLASDIAAWVRSCEG